MDFFDTLVGYEIALWDAVDQELARLGLIRLAILQPLRLVDRHDGRARVQDMSDGVGITVGAASKLVDRLERDGLVTRRPNPDNRRSSLVELTSSGRQALSAAAEASDATVARLVGDEDGDAIATTLHCLHGRLDGHPARIGA